MYAPCDHGGTMSCASWPLGSTYGPMGEELVACAIELLVVHELSVAWSHISDAKR